MSPPVVPMRRTGTLAACDRGASPLGAARPAPSPDSGAWSSPNQKACAARVGGRGVELGADAGRHRHLGQRHQQPAVGQVVRRGDQAVGDQRAHHIAVLALLDQIDRRRRALLAAADVAQIERLAEPALRLADQQDRLAGRLERKRRRLGEIGEHADAADASASAGSRWPLVSL